VLTYSPDGHRLLSAGIYDTVDLWDGLTGRLVSQITAPEWWNLGAGFDDDGYSVLITYTGLGPVYRWDTRTETATAFACKVAGRSFTQGEWREFFGDRPYEETCPGY
jgi:WD40 repeat protein